MLRDFRYKHDRLPQEAPKQFPCDTTECLHHVRPQQRDKQPWRVVNELRKRRDPCLSFPCS